jgi:hypothetical protein
LHQILRALPVTGGQPQGVRQQRAAVFIMQRAEQLGVGVDDGDLLLPILTCVATCRFTRVPADLFTLRFIPEPMIAYALLLASPPGTAPRWRRRCRSSARPAHGGRDAMTCLYRCGNACDRPVPN